jgi:hypothetical protein
VVSALAPSASASAPMAMPPAMPPTSNSDARRPASAAVRVRPPISVSHRHRRVGQATRVSVSLSFGGNDQRECVKAMGKNFLHVHHKSRCLLTYNLVEGAGSRAVSRTGATDVERQPVEERVGDKLGEEQAHGVRHHAG